MPAVFVLIRRLSRLGGIGFVFAAVIGGLWYWQERDYREHMAWMGVPEAQEAFDWHTFNRVLRNDGFLVGWSDLRANPLWVTYKLTRVNQSRHLPRPSSFREDWRSLWPVESSSYTRSGYDRGHMAPNYAISQVYGRTAQLDTFKMTNVSPQRPDLNRKVWQRLEEVVIDQFAARFGTVWVVTGPIFDNDIRRMRSLIEIPDAFFKIIVVPGKHPKALAFIIPQDVTGNEPLDRFLVSIDEVEIRTGLNFFHELPEDTAHSLESRVDSKGWNLDKVARLPSRY
ncbi:DNA/RNA non-specific endonuclease [Phytohalomonas tamaricis]|uniref:DNA/RNA non-specific endonuclease n=1 Tax=Phytohalomonas tamaricis TaxID=2081032 RepID=UPI000D0AC562|nr:DNA/RNA non-specific endonuclease [Phytohalomonas tamaricis]